MASHYGKRNKKKKKKMSAKQNQNCDKRGENGKAVKGERQGGWLKGRGRGGSESGRGWRRAGLLYWQRELVTLTSSFILSTFRFSAT